MARDHNRYCKKCDKWLDNAADYKKVIGKCVGCKKNVYEGIDANCSSPACKNESCKKCSTTLCYCRGVYSYTPGDSTGHEVECNICRELIEVEGIYTIFYCEHCNNKIASQEEWEKNKSNWQKEFLKPHEEKNGKLIINHEYYKVQIKFPLLARKLS